MNYVLQSNDELKTESDNIETAMSKELYNKLGSLAISFCDFSSEDEARVKW